MRLEGLYQHDRRLVTQKWSSYLPIYETVLAPFQDRPARLLEIGVQNGGSLEVWAAHLPVAELIVGCDVDPRCGALEFTDARVTVVVGDVADETTRARILDISPTFEIILDDGSHRSDDIISAFVHLFPMLAEGGVYVIEDLHCSYWSDFGGGLFAQRSAMSFLRRLVDVINADHWALGTDSRTILEPLIEGPLPDAFVRSLASIASIAFYDSVCVIHRDGAPAPRLGRRLVVGTTARVDTEPFEEMDQPLVPHPQSLSADHVDPIAHEDTIRRMEAKLSAAAAELHARDAAIAVLQARLTRVLTSRSWRMTQGIRSAYRLLFRRS